MELSGEILLAPTDFVEAVPGDANSIILTDAAKARLLSEVRGLELPPGCIRESAQYKLTPDAMRLSYRIVNKKVLV